ncbi:TspO and MBR like protein [Gloeothece citriformis PCC 7424]|uniref:TspO and MBR like protein n=1 Tax=Gloeothece citriformis (strain PCC 7424) TaxID=65393 RepID=B7KDD2_GLOC7|nr:tryptophan-rich sensory protein [Gloeothece citriformis]ACK68952.1 TspO and MBR like protein [Gloeothece citriformis PCC 7424]
MLKPWMIIGAVTLLVALGGLFIRPKDIPWAKHLDRPNWLFFEPAIPFIWTVIYTCGAISALFVWQADPGSVKTWLLMGLYLLIEIVTTAYIPATLRSRSLGVGKVVGASGSVLGILLFFLVLPINQSAAFFLLPYLIWSPIGTYATEQMIELNPREV